MTQDLIRLAALSFRQASWLQRDLVGARGARLVPGIAVWAEDLAAGRVGATTELTLPIHGI